MYRWQTLATGELHGRQRVLYDGAGPGIADGVALSGGIAPSESTDDPPVRRSLASLEESDPDDILPTLREGIEKLRALDDDDNRQYDNYVKRHGLKTRFTECEHGNQLFFAWHRAYLHYFEELVREVTGNERFAVPYWNWLENPELPDAFRGDDDETLVDPSRTAESYIARDIVDSEQIERRLSDPNFLRALGGWSGPDEDMVRLGAGGLEAPAHDYVHVRVGGRMARGDSPGDPLFWAHHAMVDRLWWEFNARGHPNPANEGWGEHTLELEYDYEDDNIEGIFVKGKGKPIKDFKLKTALEFPENHYTYDERIGEGEPPTSEDIQRTAEVELERLAETAILEDETLGVDTPLRGTVKRSTLEPYLSPDDHEPSQILLVADSVDLPRVPKDGGPRPGSMNAYVHLNSDHRSDESMDAGAFHFFQAPPGYRRRSYFVDLSEQLRTLSGRGRLGEEIGIEITAEKIPSGEKSINDTKPSVDIPTLSVVVTQSRIDGEVSEG